jgi:O-acetyl-ADP-ribose deacetylase (regulator of RNase III)
MITYLDISLFDSPAQTLVNTVNTVGIMGKGIALEFKKLYPDMYQKYRALCADGQLDIGKLYVYRTPNKIVVNFPTKRHWKQPSRVEYVEAGLQKFVDRYQDYGIASVSFPQLGCGNGDLDWERQVQPLMEQYLHRLPIPVYIHLYQKDANFVPEHKDKHWMKKMRLEQKRISADQLWQDLTSLITQQGIDSYQLNASVTVKIDEEQLQFSFDSHHINVDRIDVEDLWSALLQSGAIREDHFPQAINQAAGNVWLLDLLRRIDYVQPITLGEKQGRHIFRFQGLRYNPSPKVELQFETDMQV